MRMTTIVWAKFESKGKPQSDVTMHGTNREVLLALAKWLGETYMGSCIKITLARTEHELIFATQKPIRGTDENMIEELDSLLETMQGELLNGADQPDPHMPDEPESNQDTRTWHERTGRST